MKIQLGSYYLAALEMKSIMRKWEVLYTKKKLVFTAC